MRSFIRGLVLTSGLIAGATVACGMSDEDSASGEANATAAQIAGAFDVNDVSILFPTKSDPEHGGVVPYPAIRARGVVDKGEDIAKLPLDQQLWSSDVFKDVINVAIDQRIQRRATTGNDFFVMQGLWHIVGLRFDPCAPGLDDKVVASQGGKCVIQLRLIAQPFANGRFSEDFTAHLVYNLGEVPKADLSRNPVVVGATTMLGQIKAASARLGAKTAGQPLGVHPGLEAEAKSGGSELAGLVKTFIKTFSKTPSRAIAFMGLQGGGPEPWTFFVGTVDGAKNRFTLVPGPGHDASSQTLSFAGFLFIPGQGTVTPRSRFDVNTAPLFAGQVSGSDRELAFKVENPGQQHILNTDCVSCHSSSSRMNVLSLGDGPEIAARVKVPANITGYVAKTQAQDSTWNVRNFGYFADKPTVSGRTLVETVTVVQWLNKNVLAPGSNLNGPGRDCSAVDVDVWRCFRDGRSSCLAKCGQAPQPTPDVPTPTPLPIPVEPDADREPCVDPQAGGPPTVQMQALPNLGSVVAQLGGNNSACLSRLLGGAFVTNGVVIACGSPAQCIITLQQAPSDGLNALKITGEEAKRFRQFFRVPGRGVFRARGADADAGVQVSCLDDVCEIDISSDRSKLPPIANTDRMNPGQ